MVPQLLRRGSQKLQERESSRPTVQPIAMKVHRRKAELNRFWTRSKCYHLQSLEVAVYMIRETIVCFVSSLHQKLHDTWKLYIKIRKRLLVHFNIPKIQERGAIGWTSLEDTEILPIMPVLWRGGLVSYRPAIDQRNPQRALITFIVITARDSILRKHCGSTWEYAQQRKKVKKTPRVGSSGFDPNVHWKLLLFVTLERAWKLWFPAWNMTR